MAWYRLFTIYHKKDNDSICFSENTFVISSLQIGNNNDVKLEVNSAYGNIPNLTHIEPEYIYHGTAKITGNNIFITLSDATEAETVSLTISKPLHDKKRFLGIMTAVSEHAQPVAYKFACVDPHIIKDIDVQQLSKILMHRNENWGSNLMILEERDIDLFYSNNIFSRAFSR